jgi:hypothetical protein
MVRAFDSSLFADDINLIQELSLTSDWRAARSEVLTFQDENRATGSLWRNSLRLRVSGRKAAAMAERLLAEERRKNTLPPSF